MWEERTAIMQIVNSDLSKEDKLIHCFIKYIETAIAIINTNNDKNNIMTYGYIIAKGLSYSKGVYSLFFDNLVVETGALIRPSIEAFELLVYLQKYPDKIVEVSNGKKPTAGCIAKAIDGSLKPLRDYLNNYSSHIDVSNNSKQFVIDANTKQIQYHTIITSMALKENFAFITIILYLIAYETGKVLDKYLLWNQEGFDLLVKMKQQLTDLYNLEERMNLNTEDQPLIGFTRVQ